MLRLYNQNLTPDWIPEEVQLANRKKGIEAYVQTLFSKSILADQENTMKLIAQATPDTIKVRERSGLPSIAFDEYFLCAKYISRIS